jgi:hypothetical protein
MAVPPCRPGDSHCRPGLCAGDNSLCFDKDGGLSSTHGDVKLSPVTPGGGLCCRLDSVFYVFRVG